MNRTITFVLAGCWLLAMPIATVLTVGLGNSDATVTAVKPVKDEEVWPLVEASYSRKKAVAAEALASLDKMPKERVLSAVAYALGQDIHRSTALRVTRFRLKDRRLAPFLAACIRASGHWELLDAVKTAQQVPDRVLLPALVKDALGSDFVGGRAVRQYPSGIEEYFEPVWAEVGKALYIITKGEVGIEKYRRDHRPSEEERVKNVAEWRTWWEANKSRYEVPPSGQEGTAREIAPNRDEEVLGVIRWCVSADEQTRERASRSLEEIPEERVLSCVAYALEQDPYREAAVAFTKEKLSNERRLAPFLVGPIRYCRGESLVLAVETAGKMGDSVLVPALIEDALGSEYLRPERLADKEDYKRVWMATARAIYRLTKGEIGIERPDPAEFSEEKAKEALAQWRTWWEANKTDWLSSDWQERPGMGR